MGLQGMRAGARAAALGLALVASGCSDGDVGGEAGRPGTRQLTVVVLVVDSLMPHEITAATPSLMALKAGGTFYAESRAVFAAETIPTTWQ